MSLFDDDFYSTKSHRWKMPERGFRGTGRLLPKLPRDRTTRIAILSAAGGAIIMLLIGSLIWGNNEKGNVVSATNTGVVDQEKRASDLVVRTAEKVGPTVVSIMASRKDGAGTANGVSYGSGVIFQKQGDKVRIVTNAHVVEGATTIEAVIANGERRKAALVGQDAISDLAVLEVDGAGVKSVAEFGDSDTLKAGETALAVGNPLGLDHTPTITRGIISWPKRTIPVMVGNNDFEWEMEVIQTDAAINQGNSGGALVNLEGQVVGINSMKIASTGVEGMGFAIPINQVKPIIEDLLRDHKVRRPLIGIVSQDLQSYSNTDVLKLPAEVKTGLIVLDVQGPAKEAGLKTNDVIVEMDDKPIPTTLAMRKYLYGSKAIGEKLKVTYYRAGKKQTATVTLSEMKSG